MRRRERGEPAERLQALALRGDRSPASALIGRDDDVDEPLEEVALVRRTRSPGGLERLVRLEERPGPCEGEPVLV